MKKRYIERREQLLAYQKEYYRRNKEKCNEYNRKYFQQVTKSKRPSRAMERPKPPPKPKPEYTIKTTIKYKEPVAKTPKQKKVKLPAPGKPVQERSGTLSFD